MASSVLISAAELATEEIRSRIVRGDLRPGDRIQADDISRELGISRTPVRDALQELRTEGLVEIRARVGAFVRRITHREITEVYALKLAVEPLASQWAAEFGTDDQFRELKAAMDGLERAAEEGDIDDAVLSVDAIHDRLFEMTKSEVMVDVYRVFRARVRVLRQMNLRQEGRLKVSAAQHRRIVQAVLDREPVEARTAMTEHLQDAVGAVTKVLSSGTAP